ncbi:MAG: SGNH/GDSL hydrolase family protein, partial [Candidatus Omnitrophica bacterium]|nr:SGNH/GDSL hydrolase family protein [Candidatus Omnitrophota bacterium]
VSSGFIAICLACASGLVYPLVGSVSVLGLLIVLSIVGIAVAVFPTAILREILRIAPSPGPGVQNLLLTLFTVVVFLGGAEIAARIFTSGSDYQEMTPIVTVLVDGRQDYRGFHIVGDAMHVYDPELLWIPQDEEPFNEQRFRGPVLETPKRPNTVRVVCYGDSNTEGTFGEPSWPELLGDYLNDHRSKDEPRFEVVNAGVAGYSSHQGLLRFRRDLEWVEPDWIFVSFGWNDCAESAGRPDDQYQPPSQFAVILKKSLLKYRLFTVLLESITGSPDDREKYVDNNDPSMVAPRVSIEKYVHNLESFDEDAEEAGTRAVFLTRPHRPESYYDEESLKHIIRQTADYNHALRVAAKSEELEIIDVEEHYAQGPESLLADSCHFTEEGRREMARLLGDYVLQDIRSTGFKASERDTAP